MATMWLEGILLGVIANGLTAVLAHVGRSGRTKQKRQADLRAKLAKNAHMTTILHTAAVSLSREQSGLTDDEEDCLRAFLGSVDIDMIVRQMFAAELVEQGRTTRIEDIETEFLASLSLYMHGRSPRVRELGLQLFGAVLRACDHALEAAVELGVLSAHEARSAFRHRLLMAELGSLAHTIKLLTSREKPDLQAILDFEDNYRMQVGARHAYIIPPYFDALRKVPVDDIYVTPDFVPLSERQEPRREPLSVNELMGSAYRLVLLGNPGSGKSTFVRKTCHDLATRYEDRLLSRRRLTPIPVVLRDYGSDKRSHGWSIAQFIEAKASSDFQLPVPSGAIEYLLLNGRAAVLFDGLDELLDTSYRQEISADVESFCNLYSATPVLVTSREVGYEQAPLDPHVFEAFRVTEFGESQVEEYARKWFAIDTELTEVQQDQKVTSFLQESNAVPDLRSNPLMLALMCNIYRGENYIPRNRPEVYEKCALMLFERWDKGRGIHVPLPFEAHIRPAMMLLAHWIYENQSLQAGVTERDLIARTTDYLTTRRFEDRDEAEAAAREFVEFCRGRAWVFTDAGTTASGERLYQFTHRTFLEYFTAAHLVRSNPVPADLAALLMPRIAKQEWDVVAQLAFQIQDRNSEDAGDVLLSEVVKEAKSSGRTSALNLLSFAARCLEFIVPTPTTTRLICSGSLDYCMQLGRDQAPPKDEIPRHESRAIPILAPIYGLGGTSIENLGTALDELWQGLRNSIESVDNNIALLALEIALNLRHGLPEVRAFTGGRIGGRGIDLWKELLARAESQCGDRINSLLPESRWLAYRATYNGQIAVSDLARWHGVQSLFEAAGHVFFSMLTLGPALSNLHSFTQADKPASLTGSSRRYDLIRQTGRLLQRTDPPWIPLETAIRWLVREFYHDPTKPQRNTQLAGTLAPDAAFCGFGLFALLYEATASASEPADTPLLNTNHWFASRLSPMFLGRLGNVDANAIASAMDELGVNEEDRAVISRWVRNEVDFIA